MHWSDKGETNNLAMGDAWLVEQDVNLPGLELLLDTSRFVQRIALCQPQQSITHGRAYYVRYKPGTSCLVAYQLVADGEPLWVYATA